jgi:hypothetical protein
MLRFLYPRLFGQFKEGGLIRGAFVFETDDDSWTRYTTDAHTYGQSTDLLVADAGTGRVTVTFPKCKELEVLHCSIRNPTVGTFANVRHIELPPMTKTIAQAGSFELNLYDATQLADPADAAVLALALYIGK